MIPHPRSSGVESTPAIRGHFYSHSNEEKPLPAAARAAFDLLLCPDRGTARGGSSRQKIYEPLGNASMLLILSSSIHSRFTKNAGVVCTRQRSSKGNLKKRSDPPYRINHSQSSRTSPIVINILFVFFLA